MMTMVWPRRSLRVMLVVMMMLLPGVMERAALATGGDDLVAPAEVEVDFEQHIEPIFAESCYGCHGPDRQRSDFRLDRADLLLGGGTSGEPAVLPGNSAESHLIRLVAGLEPDLVMPPEGEAPLTDEQIALLRAWIDQGASNPLPETPPEERTDHWSFQPVEPVAVPDAGEDWAKNPIDRFVYQRMTGAGLEPSEPTDRANLVRRVYLIMHGLPPTPDQVRDFVEDDRPAAYERLIDRVLASPRYGERWAQPWLDAVRFGETHGYEVNTPRPNAWPYRDYVIDAFNSDKPYDQFIREQIAGDAIGGEAARGTGMLVAAPALLPGQIGQDEPSMLQAREDELAEVIDTVGGTFLGLTLSCARCHNHMFDPVTQRDYYAMQAVFQGVRYGDRPVPPTPREQQEAEAVAEQVEAIEGELAALEDAVGDGEEVALQEPVNAAGNEERFEPAEARFVRFTITETNDGLEPCIDELEIWTAAAEGEEPANVALASAGGIPSASSAWDSDRHKLEHINNGRYGNSHSWIPDTMGEEWVQIELAEPVVIDRITWARDREEHYTDRLPVDYRIDVAMDEGEWETVTSSRTRRLPDGRVPRQWVLDQLGPDLAARYQELDERLRSLRERHDRLTEGQPVWAGQFDAQPQPTHRKYRGDPTAPREVVPPASLSVLDEGAGITGFELPPDAPEQERRVALAEWIADPDHPLTARVMVNRVWHHHFGTGLVATPGDFGGLGEAPSHPELLDWLAGAFVDSGWSVKELHRLILTSQTFRQASASNSAAQAVDEASRLLWRFPPRRAEAELIRDSILHVSGSLDLTMGGPSFNPFKPNDNYVRVYEPLEEFGPEQFRRMVYMKKVRMEPEGVFSAFDMPDLATPCHNRAESTTALQALSLFNSTFVNEQAKRLAARLREEAGDVPRAQAERGFVLTLSRKPDAFESERSVDLIEQHGLEAFARAMLNLSEFVYVQ